VSLGLGVSLATIQAIGGAAPFNPASLSSSGWWRNYGGSSPWVGQSGGNLAGGSAPSAGSALDGQGVAALNGSDQNLASASAISAFFSDTQFAFAALIRPTALPSDPGANSRHTGRVLMSDGAASGYWSVAGNTTGWAVSVFDGSYKDVQAPVTSLNNWTAIFVKYSGGDMTIAANNGAFVTPVAIGSVDVMTGLLTLGTGFGGTLFQGSVAETLVRGTAWTDQERADLYSYFKARYPTASLP